MINQGIQLVKTRLAVASCFILIKVYTWDSYLQCGNLEGDHSQNVLHFSFWFMNKTEMGTVKTLGDLHATVIIFCGIGAEWQGPGLFFGCEFLQSTFS